MASDAIRQGDFESTATGGVALHEVWTAFLGFFLDIYDIYLPIIVLAPAYAYFKPSGLNAPVLDSFIFASALLGRPEPCSSAISPIAWAESAPRR